MSEPDFEALARKHGCNCITPDGRLIAEPASVKLAREAYALGRAASVRQEPAQPFVVEDPDAPREPTTEWRPIETAPRDGRPIILRSGPESWPGFWHDGNANHWRRAGFFAEEDRYSLLTARPIDADGWLPLPAAPWADFARNRMTLRIALHWFSNYVVRDLCGLCGNRGWIDTRGTKTAAGVECGGVFWCICPNGHAMRRADGGKGPRIACAAEEAAQVRLHHGSL